MRPADFKLSGIYAKSVGTCKTAAYLRESFFIVGKEVMSALLRKLKLRAKINMSVRDNEVKTPCKCFRGRIRKNKRSVLPRKERARLFGAYYIGKEL